MFILTHVGYNRLNIVPHGNRFLIGNGHLGYRGTLEEYQASESVALNIVGAYDRMGEKWRESLNAPNPFFVTLTVNNEYCDTLKKSPKNHVQRLDLKHGLFERETTFKNAVIRSQRFVDKNHVENLAMRYEFTALISGQATLRVGIDHDVWDTNGPHLHETKVYMDKAISYVGVTNENQYLAVSAIIQTDFTDHPIIERKEGKLLKKFSLNVVAGQTYTVTVFADVRFGSSSHVFEESEKGVLDYASKSYQKRLAEHKKTWNGLWKIADVKLKGDQDADFALRYSIYHLLILSPTKYLTSIPARGLSGQTYKGAIFWDTEIFMLPFYHITDPEIAKNLIRYRIKTLPGAKRKAQTFGYKGAFYAWESQETGDEACSLYNVSDAQTGKPIRTYFADKQIHISGDVALGIANTYERTQDFSLLLEGGLQVLLEVGKFYKSYATYDSETKLYHLNDVIGPDEYHERVNDNAFTNYLAKHAAQLAVHYGHLVKHKEPKLFKAIMKKVGQKSLGGLSFFADHLYCPLPNENGIIEQFNGYFQKEDVRVEAVRSRLKTANEYWGGALGVAVPTRVIKQADVVTLMVLFPDLFTTATKKANFHFYEPYTEHGSSLSACMYGLLACQIKQPEWAYPFFLKSATIDLTGESKQYAGSIYIGGTHPAANGGAYLTAIHGFAGLKYTEKGIRLKPVLPSKIKSIKFKFYDRGVLKVATVTHKGKSVRKVHR